MWPSQLHRTQPRLWETPFHLQVVVELHTHGTTSTCFTNISSKSNMVLLSFHQKVKYISTVDVIKDKVEQVGRLEGALESHEGGMLPGLQEHIPLPHHIALLQVRGQRFLNV